VSLTTQKNKRQEINPWLCCTANERPCKQRALAEAAGLQSPINLGCSSSAKRNTIITTALNRERCKLWLTANVRHSVYLKSTWIFFLLMRHLIGFYCSNRAVVHGETKLTLFGLGSKQSVPFSSSHV